MYYFLLALLFRVGIKSENHTASIFLLKELFGLDNSEMLKAKKERIDKQYYVDFKIVESDVKDLIKVVENFNGKIFDFLEKMSLSEIERIREKFIEIIS